MLGSCLSLDVLRFVDAEQRSPNLMKKNMQAMDEYRNTGELLLVWRGDEIKTIQRAGAASHLWYLHSLQQSQYSGGVRGRLGGHLEALLKGHHLRASDDNLAHQAKLKHTMHRREYTSIAV